GPALRGMPAARARHRRQLLRLRRRSADHRAATRTRRPARAASAGPAALPRLATPPRDRYAPATRDSRQHRVTVCHDAQDPAPTLVTGRVAGTAAPPDLARQDMAVTLSSSLTARSPED